MGAGRRADRQNGQEAATGMPRNLAMSAVSLRFRMEKTQQKSTISVVRGSTMACLQLSSAHLLNSKTPSACVPVSGLAEPHSW